MSDQASPPADVLDIHILHLHRYIVRLGDLNRGIEILIAAFEELLRSLDRELNPPPDPL